MVADDASRIDMDWDVFRLMTKNELSSRRSTDVAKADEQNFTWITRDGHERVMVGNGYRYNHKALLECSPKTGP